MFDPVVLSLRDLLGDDYLDAVIASRHALTGRPIDELDRLASERVEFFPRAFAERSDELAARAGEHLTSGYPGASIGAPTAAFRTADNPASAPLAGLGVCRVGQDGRIHIAAKSEHYQLPLGHAFPGYRLIDHARALGIVNATHNNTRGHITRLTERALVAAANGVPVDAVDAAIANAGPHTLSRVINLETGSLAAEAAIKMMLARFFAVEGGDAPLAGRTPVLLVMGDAAGGTTGNYHGTTIVAQMLRGLWPSLASAGEEAELFRIVPVETGDLDALRVAIETHTTASTAVAGFLHEIILMNYGGIRQDPGYLQEAYRLCHDAGIPVFCDEIQSGAWYGELFLFRRFGLDPDLVSIGKGFPGGEYPASKVLVTAELDSLSQFGALVTNGQEELASLAYLVTMAFVSANTAEVDRIGERYQQMLAELATRHPALIAGITGDQHMAGIEFHDAETATRFCRELDAVHGIDISAQAYKQSAPPVALTKLPVITSTVILDTIVARMERVLGELTPSRRIA